KARYTNVAAMPARMRWSESVMSSSATAPAHSRRHQAGPEATSRPSSAAAATVHRYARATAELRWPRRAPSAAPALGTLTARDHVRILDRAREVGDDAQRLHPEAIELPLQPPELGSLLLTNSRHHDHTVGVPHQRNRIRDEPGRGPVDDRHRV